MNVIVYFMTVLVIEIAKVWRIKDTPGTNSGTKRGLNGGASLHMCATISSTEKANNEKSPAFAPNSAASLRLPDTFAVFFVRTPSTSFRLYLLWLEFLSSALLSNRTSTVLLFTLNEAKCSICAFVNIYFVAIVMWCEASSSVCGRY